MVLKWDTSILVEIPIGCVLFLGFYTRDTTIYDGVFIPHLLIYTVTIKED